MRKQLFDLVAEIPYGHVVSYWALAVQLDVRYQIKTSWRMVWRMLSSMPESERMSCPWRRVINRQWYVSALKLGTKWLIQKQLLEKEWIAIINDTIDMKKYEWKIE